MFWYQKAAEQGKAIAQFNLGTMYLLGQGVPKDDQQAVFWFRKAAEQGDAVSQSLLGTAYVDGRGVPKDDQQAVVWYRKAAEQGQAEAQSNLGLMYANGRGVPKDDQLAYFWSLLASVEGEAISIRNRSLFGQRVSASQRAAAQTDAREWKPKAAAPVRFLATNRVPSVAPTSMPTQREAANSTGSGFCVASARVVTNHHVTQGCTRLRVGGQFEGRVLSNDARNDLALIALQSGPTEVATVRTGKVKVGEAALAAGFPLSGLLSGFNITTGNVSSLAGLRGDTQFLQITAPIQAGNSGGPLLNTSSNVIGIVVSKLNALKVANATGDVPQNVNFAINANVLASFLDANGVDYKTATRGPVLPTHEIARRAQAFTVLIECWN